MNHRSHYIFSVFFAITLSLGLNACSNHSREGETASISNKKAAPHTHLANKCIDAVSHAHSNGKKEHLHHYHSCESTRANSNAHSHSSSSITGFTRHVHPNGASTHTHNR